MQNQESLLQNLEDQAWAFSDSMLPASLWQNLAQASDSFWQKGLFQEAHIGRGAGKSRQSEIRGDSILWLNEAPESPAVQEFLRFTENLRQELNQRFFLGLRRGEFHFARYPEGKGYQKHIDQHRQQNHRKISLVFYLNSAWPDNAGGELCIYSPEQDDQILCKIAPHGGRLVLFRSDVIPHEVLPAHRPRQSVTGWFRTDDF